MDVFQSGTPVDYFEYFSKQFPEVVLNMARLRDELALRQGAINAVQDTLKAREEAQFILANAKKEAEDLLARTQKELETAEIKSAQASDILKSYKTQVADFNRSVEAQMAQLNEKKAFCQSRSDALDAKEQDLQTREKTLLSAQTELERKIKEFQSRVANIAGLAG